jgi:hypothetical protein
MVILTKNYNLANIIFLYLKNTRVLDVKVNVLFNNFLDNGGELV